MVLMFLWCDLIVFLLWSFDSPTQAFEEEGTRIANVVPMLTLVTEKELHVKSARKVLYIYIYIYMYACLHILCSYVLLVLLCIYVLMLS